MLRPTFQHFKIKNWSSFVMKVIYLPKDKYGTQIIITFLRQISEKGEYWHHINIKLEQIGKYSICWSMQHAVKCKMLYYHHDF